MPPSDKKEVWTQLYLVSRKLRTRSHPQSIILKLTPLSFKIHADRIVRRQTRPLLPQGAAALLLLPRQGRQVFFAGALEALRAGMLHGLPQEELPHHAQLPPALPLQDLQRHGRGGRHPHLRPMQVPPPEDAQAGRQPPREPPPHQRGTRPCPRHPAERPETHDRPDHHQSHQPLLHGALRKQTAHRHRRPLRRLLLTFYLFTPYSIISSLPQINRRHSQAGSKAVEEGADDGEGRGMSEGGKFIQFEWPMLSRQPQNRMEGEVVLHQPIEPYRTVNAYTHRPSCEQLTTIFLFAVEVALHSVFVTPAIPQQQSPILWVLLALTYIFLLFIITDYFYLTCSDPADRLLLPNQERPSRVRVRTCLECGHLVQEESYHCRRCSRCVEEFDHHCKFLNNCIGGQNYQSFIRLLLTLTCFCLTAITEGIWVFVLATTDAEFGNGGPSRWGVLTSIIVSFLIMIAVDSLLCFHCYIVLCLETSTLEYLWDRQSEAHLSQQPLPPPDPQLYSNPRAENEPIPHDMPQ